MNAVSRATLGDTLLALGLAGMVISAVVWVLL